MNIFEINPYIRVSIHCTLANTIKMRVIFDYELIYVEEGILNLSYNGTLFQFKKGDILLICPDIPHDFANVTPEVLVPHIHFDLSYDHLSFKRFVSFRNHSALTSDEQRLIQANAFPRLSYSPLLTIRNKKAFLEKFFSIIDSNAPQSLVCKTKMLELLNTIIVDNVLDSFDSDIPAPNVVSLIKNYIDSNYEQNFQLSDLEKQFGYSKFYIDKLFRKEVGTSVIQYRCRLRLTNSLQLLQKYSVTKTAQMLGFSSLQNFCRAFRAFYNESPTEYIRKLQDEKSDIN